MSAEPSGAEHGVGGDRRTGDDRTPHETLRAVQADLDRYWADASYGHAARMGVHASMSQDNETTERRPTAASAVLMIVDHYGPSEHALYVRVYGPLGDPHSVVALAAMLRHQADIFDPPPPDRPELKLVEP